MKKNDSIWIFVEIGVACSYASTLLYKFIYPEPNDRFLGIIWMILGMIALIAPLVHLYFKLTASKTTTVRNANEVLKSEDREQTISKLNASVPTTVIQDAKHGDTIVIANQNVNENAVKSETAEPVIIEEPVDVPSMDDTDNKDDADAEVETADTTSNDTSAKEAPFLNDPLSKAFFDGLVEANFLDDNYQPKDTILKSQLVYMVATISDILNTTSHWSTYEEFWNMKNFRQNYKSIFNRNSSVTNKEAIDQVFLLVGLNHDRIKNLRAFIRWKANLPE